MVPCGQAPHTPALHNQTEWPECHTYSTWQDTGRTSAPQSQRQRVLLTLDIAMAGQASQARAPVLHLTVFLSGGIPCSEPGLS